MDDACSSLPHFLMNLPAVPRLGSAGRYCTADSLTDSPAVAREECAASEGFAQGEEAAPLFPDSLPPGWPSGRCWVAHAYSSFRLVQAQRRSQRRLRSSTLVVTILS